MPTETAPAPALTAVPTAPVNGAHDPETDAVASISATLAALTPGARARVLAWVAARFPFQA